MTPMQQKKPKQPRPPRKKTCKSCTTSKVRCSLERPSCSRCRTLGKPCEYATPSTEITQRNGSPLSPGPAVNLPVSGGVNCILSDIPVSQPNAFVTPRRDQEVDLNHQHDTELDFTDVDLLPNAEAEFIRDRWLRPYVMSLVDGIEVPKIYHPFTLQYLGRVLATYPHLMMRDGDMPPIIHHSQVSGKQMTTALANCYTIVRMWKNAAPGSHSIVVSTVRREMERLAVEIPGQPEIESLSAFQAYLIYLLLLYFSPTTLQTPGQLHGKVTDQDMITLMDLAYRAVRCGLISASEKSQKRASWESWVIASTKRRAIYGMYLFSSLYNAGNGLPNFIAEELRDLPVPEGKGLWEARTRTEWEWEYDLQRQEWPDGVLRIRELWKDEGTGSPRRRERVERWLRGVDDFGMMLFSVCAHIHGC
ncbi:hypothetical protein BDV19DRAFT_295273 [Aspergillus venezuelensis]